MNRSSGLHLIARIERERAGYTSREQVEGQAECSSRYLADIEGGKRMPGPYVIAQLGTAYQSKRLLRTYCRECPVKCAMNNIACTGARANQNTWR